MQPLAVLLTLAGLVVVCSLLDGKQPTAVDGSPIVVTSTTMTTTILGVEDGYSSNNNGATNNSSRAENARGAAKRSGAASSSSAAAAAEPVPMVRLPSNTLLKYSAYKDVSILHFRVPADTRTVLFSFKAYDESKSAFQRGCEPRDVSLHLKAGSYPVISPENITFPLHFLNADQRFDIHTLQFKSDGTTKRVSIDGPQPGNWFAIAYISWTDPNNDRIEQQGLASSCETLLLSEMAIAQTTPTYLNPGVWHNDTLHPAVDASATADADNSSTGNTAQPDTATSSLHTYKFFVPRHYNAVLVHVRIRDSTCSNAAAAAECPELLVRVQAHALPSDADNLQSTVIPTTANQSDVVTDFYPQQDAWHYIDVGYLLATSDEAAAAAAAEEEGTGEEADEADETEAEAFDDDGPNKNQTRTAQPAGPPVQYSLRFELVRDDQRLDHAGLRQLDLPSFDLNLALPQRDFDYHPLLRQTYREFFMYDYDLMPDHNGTVPAFVNLTGGQTSGFRVRLGDVYDIGGTLSFAVAMRETDRHDVRIRTAPLMSTQNGEGSGSEGGGGSGAVAEKLVASAAAATAPVNRTASAVVTAPKQTVPIERINQTVIICMRLGEPGIPTWPDRCLYGRRLLPAAIVINNTNDDTSTGVVHVPFPESGEWFITMELFCTDAAEAEAKAAGGTPAALATAAARDTILGSVRQFVRENVQVLFVPADGAEEEALWGHTAACPCRQLSAAASNVSTLAGWNETETLRVKECLMDAKCTDEHVRMSLRFEELHRRATQAAEPDVGGSGNGGGGAGGVRIGAAACNASAQFTISSSPCVTGRCGRFGRCYHYMSGGFVFSTCLCVKGYRGWDCTENTQVPSGWSILFVVLLLTLSNLLFLPSIYFAVRRNYHTEAVIYFFAMFFSIFYHACDSGEDEYGFCLVKIGVLQFCDFYCGLLAIWVTLIAMAHVRPSLVSLLHMFGAIVLAFGTELNKQALWVFLAPALTGICVISVSWGWRCRRTRTWFPSRRYLTVFLPVGAVLVMVGLVCYAFLQTRQNYHVVHSVWHMVMALSILCLLPGRESFLPKC